jgi:hypothetical protein
MLLASLCGGCGGGDQPALGFVKGNVTLDGKPLAGAIVVANPDVGRAGTANIDEEGNYELFYKNGVRGTKLGPTTFAFTWPTGGSGPAIPSRYAEKSELKREVQRGENRFDFVLESESEPSQGAKAPVRTRPLPLD